MKRRIIESYGEVLVFENQVYWMYPEPAKIAVLTIETLQKIGLTRRKVEYFLAISQQLIEGKISKEHYLNHLDAQIAEKELTKLRRIGPWTANYLLMRCFRIGEAFPIGDVGLLNGIKAIEQSENKPDNVRMLELKEQWGAWCSYATFYIWRVLY